MAVTINASTTAGLVNSADTSGILQLQTANTTALTIDASQNVGVGTTPAAWTSNHKVVQFGATGVLANNTSQFTTLATNYYNASGGDTYIANGFATRYYQLSGQHVWNTAPSGTTGNPITFTQAMTLDASGNLLVGTTTSRNKLTVAAGEIDTPTLGTASGASFLGNTTAAYGTMFGTSGFGYGWIQQQRVDGTATAYDLVLQPVGGNLLVGTTSGSGNNERVNITSSTNQTARFVNTNATSGNISIVSTLGANTDNTSSYHFLTATNGATRFYVYGNGTSGNASDQNLKKNIETTRDGYAEDLCKLRVVKYNWNDQADGSPKELGWIAQEVEQVFPNLVQNGIPNENGETFKEVKTSVLPFMLLKALQEQQAIIESLTQRITALEGAQA